MQQYCLFYKQIHQSTGRWIYGLFNGLRLIHPSSKQITAFTDNLAITEKYGGECVANIPTHDPVFTADNPIIASNPVRDNQFRVRISIEI